MSFTAQLVIHCNCFSVNKFNSKYYYETDLLIIFAMMKEIKCYKVIGMCFFMLFFLTVKCQCKFYFKLNFLKTDVWRLLGNTDIHLIGASDDLIVFIVFHQFGVIS